jgi:hypothetical protein
MSLRPTGTADHRYPFLDSCRPCRRRGVVHVEGPQPEPPWGAGEVERR